MTVAADSSEPVRLEFDIEAGDAGRRLDQFLAQAVTEHSRTRLQGWIRDGCLQIDGEVVKSPRHPLHEGARLQLQIPRLSPVNTEVLAQPIPLDILFEDEDLLVLAKPAGLTVHPGAGQPDGTLQNALLHHRPALAALPRAGIIHRLDKLTSGLMVIAASPEAHTQLVRELAEREIQREYLALIWGEVIAGGSIDAPLARDPRDRRRYVVANGGRDARTHYRVEKKMARHTLLRLQLETGRTHQIRVHMKHRKWPLVGDPVYGRRGDPYRASLGRQALHATRLKFRHPRTGVSLEFERTLPEDMQQLLDQLLASQPR